MGPTSDGGLLGEDMELYQPPLCHISSFIIKFLNS